MSEHTPIDSSWLLLTLEDAMNTLQSAIDRIQAEPRAAQGVMEHEIPELYAKLNYAVNTCHGAPEDLENMDHDALLTWPENLPFWPQEAFDDEEAE